MSILISGAKIPMFIKRAAELSCIGVRVKFILKCCRCLRAQCELVHASCPIPRRLKNEAARNPKLPARQAPDSRPEPAGAGNRPSCWTRQPHSGYASLPRASIGSEDRLSAGVLGHCDARNLAPAS